MFHRAVLGTDHPLHVFTAEGTQHVFYLARPDIIELWWRSGEEPQASDLSDRSSGDAEPAASAPASHVFDAEGTQHVFYVAEDGNIVELWWRSGGEPQHEDLTVQSGGAPLAARELPTSHVFRAEGTQHVVFTSTDARIIELRWQAT